MRDPRCKHEYDRHLPFHDVVTDRRPDLALSIIPFSFDASTENYITMIVRSSKVSYLPLGKTIANHHTPLSRNNISSLKRNERLWEHAYKARLRCGEQVGLCRTPIELLAVHQT